MLTAATVGAVGAEWTGGGVEDGGGGALRLANLFIFGGAAPFGPADVVFVRPPGAFNSGRLFTGGGATANALG